ncbi:unnamed protein product [Protopolystoma xenopodis]|uniref:Uncharacterized protein n=1 Tax=Protopolystoma xenopodis TaxID=117903 RepID=A0A448X6H7_9PLAT|nr:unnamed protein product [Protopolystoma xenopodis]
MSGCHRNLYSLFRDRLVPTPKGIGNKKAATQPVNCEILQCLFPFGEHVCQSHPLEQTYVRGYAMSVLVPLHPDNRSPRSRSALVTQSMA